MKMPNKTMEPTPSRRILFFVTVSGAAHLERSAKLTNLCVSCMKNPANQLDIEFFPSDPRHFLVLESLVQKFMNHLNANNVYTQFPREGVEDTLSGKKWLVLELEGTSSEFNAEMLIFTFKP